MENNIPKMYSENGYFIRPYKVYDGKSIYCYIGMVKQLDDTIYNALAYSRVHVMFRTDLKQDILKFLKLSDVTPNKIAETTFSDECFVYFKRKDVLIYGPKPDNL